MLRLLLRLGLTGCLWFATVPGGTSKAQDLRGLKEVRYRESRSPLANPERGFYAPRMSDRMNGLEGVRARGITLVLVEMNLREFKDREISPEKLDELRQAFALARENGLKVVFRAAYGFTERDYRADPKDLGRIVGHIKQLGAIFEADRDVLLGVQAGFLGPWGEWHGSNHGDPPSLEARRAVLFGLLEAVPTPIAVQVRRPMFIRDFFSSSELTARTGLEGTALSRTGWHDDALLSLPSDLGTYAEAGWDRDRELRWSDNHGRYTLFGGETVPSSAKTPIDQVVRELEQLHATYLNSSYHRGTLDGWRKSDYQGENAYDLIERRLGYRLVADRLRYQATVAPGGTVRVELELKNVGFAAPRSPRQVALVLSRGENQYRVVAEGVDPRRWSPNEVIRVDCALHLPPNAPVGSWELSLELADPSLKLRNDGRYSIQLANEEIHFSEQSGANLLTRDVEIR